MTQPKALKRLNRGWVVIRFACLIFILNGLGGVLITPAAAQSKPDEITSNQTMIYEVYAGGIHAMQAHLDIQTSQDASGAGRYDIVLDAKTRGLLGKLAPWEGSFETHGWIIGGDFKPQQHKSTAIWRDEEEVKDYAYGKDGQFISLTIDKHDKPPEKRDTPTEITADTIDALTATLLMLNNYNDSEECAGSSLVFDGKRSFEQKFIHEDSVVLSASKYNIFNGNAAQCIVEVVPKEGAWHSKPRGWLSIQEQGRERGTMPTLWVGKIGEDARAIPIKIRVKTAYGTLFMHLAEYQNDDGTIIVVEKRVLDEEKDRPEKTLQ